MSMAGPTSLYIKLYEGETNTRVLVLLDVSGSMNYGSGDIKKIDYARILAASSDVISPITSGMASAC